MRLSQRRGAQVRRTARHRFFESAGHEATSRRCSSAANRNGAGAPERKTWRPSSPCWPRWRFAKNKSPAANTSCAASGGRISSGSFCTNLPGTTIVGAKSPRLWNTVSALMPEGVATALAVEARQGRICGLHRLGLHDRQGRAVARAGGDGIQGGGSASRAAVQQRLGNQRSRLGRAGQRPGESPRRSASRQGVSRPNSRRRGELHESPIFRGVR